MIDAHWQGVTKEGPVTGAGLIPWTTVDRAALDRIVALPKMKGQGIVPYPIGIKVAHGDSNGHSSGYRTEGNVGGLHKLTWKAGEHHWGSMGFMLPDLSKFNTKGSNNSDSWGILMQYHPPTSTQPDFGFDYGKGQSKVFCRGSSGGQRKEFDIPSDRNVIHQFVWEIKLGSGGGFELSHKLSSDKDFTVIKKFTGPIGTVGDYPKTGGYFGKTVHYPISYIHFGFRAGCKSFDEAAALFGAVPTPTPDPIPDPIPTPTPTPKADLVFEDIDAAVHRLAGVETWTDLLDPAHIQTIVDARDRLVIAQGRFPLT